MIKEWLKRWILFFDEGRKVNQRLGRIERILVKSKASK